MKDSYTKEDAEAEGWKDFFDLTDEEMEHSKCGCFEVREFCFDGVFYHPMYKLKMDKEEK